MEGTLTKPTRRSGTQKQKKLAQVLVENLTLDKPKTAGELLVIAGYDETTAMASPARTIEQAGVKAELERLGFSEQKAKEVVGSIMNSEDEESKDRLKAAEMVFKVFGSFVAEKPAAPAVVNYNVFQNPVFQVELKKFEESAKALIENATPTEKPTTA